MFGKRILVSFRCYFLSGRHQDMSDYMFFDDIARWVESFFLAHPDCTHISVIFSKFSD